MKKPAIFLALVMATMGLTACGGNKVETKDAGKEIKVFAAASMTESLNEIAEKYKAETGTTVTLTLDSSGTLKQQIESGADCDLFISAANKQMDAIEKDYVKEGTRTDLLENKVVLAVTEENPDDITAFEDLNTDKAKKIALGNADVPVGQYSEEILKNMGIWDDIQSKVSFGSNVKEVTTWVSEGTVSCGIIYATDAKAAKLKAVAEADGSLLQTPVIYPAAVMKNSKNSEEAEKFLNYIKTNDEAKKVFTEAGFTTLN